MFGAGFGGCEAGGGGVAGGGGGNGAANKQAGRLIATVRRVAAVFMGRILVVLR